MNRQVKHTLVLAAAAVLVAQVALANARPGATPDLGSRPRINGEGDFIAGIRIANLTTDTNALQADFDVSEFLTTSFGASYAWLGVWVPYYGQIMPAIDFGDGSTLPANSFSNLTGIPFASSATLATVGSGSAVVRVYRGSFSHTYPDAGPFTLTVDSMCCDNSAGGTVVNGGNRNQFTVYSSGYGTYTYTNFSAFTEVDFAPVPSVIEVPTASTAGLLALGLLLATAGMLVLRRT